VAVVLFVLLLGKVFCSWICPVAPVRSLLDILGKRFGARKNKSLTALGGDAGGDVGGDAALVGVDDADAFVSAALGGDATVSVSGGCGSKSSCSSCASRRAKLDSRHIVLGGSLLSALVFGFPVFCLICPIGLIFGTVIVVWQLIGFEDVSLSLLIYPLMLVVELLVLRKWCARFCPLGALMSLLSLPNRFVRPVVRKEKCIRLTGGSCQVCAEVCPEQLDPHNSEGMQECSKCGICKDKCPAGAIGVALLPKKS
jgi:ferredoxin-type protein NapH